MATEVLAQTYEYLAIWLGDIVDLLEPEVIILGGGVAEMLRPHFGEIQKRMQNWCINSRYQEIPIVPAHYGENAGIAGGGDVQCRQTHGGPKAARCPPRRAAGA